MGATVHFSAKLLGVDICLSGCNLLKDAIQLIFDFHENLRVLSNPENLKVLKILTQEMIKTIDFDACKMKNQFVVKHGISSELDAKKQQYTVMPHLMSTVASEEVKTLPEYIEGCCVAYIPEVGYLLALTEWKENLTTAEVTSIPGIEFQFKCNGMVYYRSPRTQGELAHVERSQNRFSYLMLELDKVLGDCVVAIMEKETAIMIYLTELILSYNSVIIQINTLVSELDSLISMAMLAKSGNYVRPFITSGNDNIEIVEGRHPLVEDLCDFVSNSTIFSENERIVILTGPNSSGKSIYLKQVAVITIMALCGSFVPVKSAKIPTYDRICTRIHVTESVSTGFSTFLLDINQMSLALRTSSRQSLILIDEFGKGTAEVDGLSLLLSSVDTLLRRGVNCPTVFLTTHFFTCSKYLRSNPSIKFQYMKFLRGSSDDSGGITYLYELHNGKCTSSFARAVAEQVGINKSAIDRSLELEEIISDPTCAGVVPIANNLRNVELEMDSARIADIFMKVNENQNMRDILNIIGSIFNKQFLEN